MPAAGTGEVKNSGGVGVRDTYESRHTQHPKHDHVCVIVVVQAEGAANTEDPTHSRRCTTTCGAPELQSVSRVLVAAAWTRRNKTSAVRSRVGLPSMRWKRQCTHELHNQTQNKRTSSTGITEQIRVFNPTVHT